LHGSLFQALPVWQSFHHPIADWRHNKSSCMTITTIDCHYLDRPEFAAAYLLVDGDEAAFIDNNTHHALPRLLAALAGTGLAAEQVRYLIITHVHLDHAGGTSALAQACPQATVLAHPRAARHVIDPDKLIASAKSVYGEDEFRRLYGEIEPVDKDRVQSIEDGEKVTLGSASWNFCTRAATRTIISVSPMRLPAAYLPATHSASSILPCSGKAALRSRPPARPTSMASWPVHRFDASPACRPSAFTRRIMVRW
jgi:hypothetical protein